jgi:hypothetical protein
MARLVDWSDLSRSSALFNALQEPARLALRLLDLPASMLLFSHGDRPKDMYFVICGPIAPIGWPWAIEFPSTLTTSSGTARSKKVLTKAVASSAVAKRGTYLWEILSMRSPIHTWQIILFMRLIEAHCVQEPVSKN